MDPLQPCLSSSKYLVVSQTLPSAFGMEFSGCHAPFWSDFPPGFNLAERGLRWVVGWWVLSSRSSSGQDIVHQVWSGKERDRSPRRPFIWIWYPGGSLSLSTFLSPSLYHTQTYKNIHIHARPLNLSLSYTSHTYREIHTHTQRDTHAHTHTHTHLPTHTHIPKH